MDINKPLDSDITIKMDIFARDGKGRVYKLIFHSESDIESKTNVFLDYSDRVMEGSIVFEEVKQALLEDLGIDEIIQMKMIDSPVEDLGIEDPLLMEITKELDYHRDVVVEIKYEPDLPDNNNLGNDLFVTWLEMEAEK